MNSAAEKKLADYLLNCRIDKQNGKRLGARTACEFVLLHGFLAHGNSWLGSRRRNSSQTSASAGLVCRLEQLGIPLHPKQKQKVEPLKDYVELLESFQLKGVREDSALGLLGWLQSHYKLQFRTDRPTPREMLDIQCRGERVATMHIEWEEQFEPIGRHPNAYHFLLHDLEHAHKFFGATYLGQIRFFNQLRLAIENGLFDRFKKDSQFQTELDYLMSDMNSHPVHLLKYLKAIVLTAFKRTTLNVDAEFDDWSVRLFSLWNLDQDVRAAAFRINFPDRETEADRRLIAEAYLNGESLHLQSHPGRFGQSGHGLRREFTGEPFG